MLRNYWSVENLKLPTCTQCIYHIIRYTTSYCYRCGYSSSGPRDAHGAIENRGTRIAIPMYAQAVSAQMVNTYFSRVGSLLHWAKPVSRASRKILGPTHNFIHHKTGHFVQSFTVSITHSRHFEPTLSCEERATLPRRRVASRYFQRRPSPAHAEVDKHYALRQNIHSNKARRICYLLERHTRQNTSK